MKCVSFVQNNTNGTLKCNSVVRTEILHAKICTIYSTASLIQKAP